MRTAVMTIGEKSSGSDGEESQIDVLNSAAGESA